MTAQDFISWFRYYVIDGPDFNRNFPKFPPDLGGLIERLGQPTFCAVGLFPFPNLTIDKHLRRAYG